MNLPNAAVFDDFLLQRARDATASLGGDGRAFVEQREDLTLEAYSGEPIRTRFVATSGSCVTRGGSSRYASDPAPAPAGFLDVAGARRWVERLRARTGPEAGITCVASEQRVAVGGPGSDPVLDRRRGMRVRLEMRLRQGGRSVADAVWRPGREPDPDAFVAAARARALARSRAADPPEGSMPVIFAPGVAGIVLHELVGHPLEEDAIDRGASWLTPPTGEIAARTLRVVDDPRRGRIPWRIDDTGEAVAPISLIEEGRVVQTVGRTRLRRASFADPLLPRMGCTFLAAGSSTAEESLRGVTTGLYVRRLEAASVDARTGRATFRVVDADVVRDGSIGDPVRACLLSLTAAHALRAFECIAEDVEFDTCLGTCFKGGQPLAVSVGAPTCRLGMARVHAGQEMEGSRRSS